MLKGKDGEFLTVFFYSFLFYGYGVIRVFFFSLERVLVDRFLVVVIRILVLFFCRVGLVCRMSVGLAVGVIYFRYRNRVGVG